MTPIVHGLRDEFEGRVRVERLNVAQPEQAAVQQAYDLNGHPTFVVIDASGNVTGRFFGIVDESVLRQAAAAVAP